MGWAKTRPYESWSWCDNGVTVKIHGQMQKRLHIPGARGA